MFSYSMQAVMVPTFIKHIRDKHGGVHKRSSFVKMSAKVQGRNDSCYHNLCI